MEVWLGAQPTPRAPGPVIPRGQTGCSLVPGVCVRRAVRDCKYSMGVRESRRGGDTAGLHILPEGSLIPPRGFPGYGNTSDVT